MQIFGRPDAPTSRTMLLEQEIRNRTHLRKRPGPRVRTRGVAGLNLAGLERYLQCELNDACRFTRLDNRLSGGRRDGAAARLREH